MFADRDTKMDHLGILKELSLSKTRKFERDRSFFLLTNKQKNRGIVNTKTKEEGCSVIHYMDVPRDRLYKRTCLVTP